MGLSGKILAVLNLLAAIGFLTVAIMDYGKQRAWSTLIFEEDVLRVGLPLDESELDENGAVIAKKLGTYSQQQLMSGGQPVTTQVAEVKQRQTAVQSAIDGAGGEAEQRQKMAEILLPLATSFGEREAWKKQIASEPMDKLRGDDGPLKAAFREALEGKTVAALSAGPDAGAATPRNIDRDLQKQAIAHLLFNLGDKPQGYDQRLQAIIGLEAFLKEVTRQLAVNKNLLDAYEIAIRKESLPFEVKYRELLNELIVSAGHLQEQIDALQKEENSRDMHRKLVGLRKQDVSTLQNEIAAAQKNLDAALTRQKELEVALDKANKDAAALVQGNKSLEQQVRSRELGR
jgi:hypothetical protein